MNALRDLLGALNDARTARRLLTHVQLKTGCESNVALAHGDDVIEGAVLVRAEAERDQLARQWHRYDKLKKPGD